MYVSIDIETLGLDPDCCDMIEFGAVIDNFKDPIEQLPTFHRYILPPKREIVVNGHPKDTFTYQGDPYAMAMHKEKLAIIAEKDPFYRFVIPKNLSMEFWCWLVNKGYTNEDHGDYGSVKIVVAGKNFQGFDMRFLRRLPDFEKYIRIHHRAHDPTQLYFDPRFDSVLPDLSQCLQRAGIEKSVAHSALADAIDVIRVLRCKWGLSYLGWAWEHLFDNRKQVIRGSSH